MGMDAAFALLMLAVCPSRGTITENMFKKVIETFDGWSASATGTVLQKANHPGTSETNS